MSEIPESRLMATSSVSEGLEFGCNLLSSRIAYMHAKPDLCVKLLSGLTCYISYQYAGEWGLALEALIETADMVDDEEWKTRLQFWAQLEWVAKQMNVEDFDFEERKLKFQ